MSLFIDTSGLYALIVATEREHAAVATVFRSAAEKGRRMTTTNYVLSETSALLQRRIGINPVRDLHDRLVPLLKVVWVTEEMHRRGLEQMLRIDKRGVSLVDCVSFVTMQDEALTDVPRT